MSTRQLVEPARPVVLRSAGLDADQAGRQLLKERQKVATPQLPADSNLACSIDTMNLEKRLGDVEANGRNRLHG